MTQVVQQNWPGLERGGDRPAELDLRIELGRQRLSVDEISQLQIGSVLELSSGVADHVDVFVGGRLVARGQAVEIGGRFGVRIRELTTS